MSLHPRVGTDTAERRRMAWIEFGCFAYVRREITKMLDLVRVMIRLVDPESEWEGRGD